MNESQVITYLDVQNMYLELGWGCKCCGRLNSVAWYQCEGDTYCQGCKNHIAAEVLDAKFEQYPDGPQTYFPIKTTEQGFEVAAHYRLEHERIYGYLPSYTGEC